MSSDPEVPIKYTRVGTGIIVVNNKGEILMGRRKGSFAPYFSLPGGHLEPGETFEDNAVREAKEETNLDISNPKVIGVTNNLETYRLEGKPYVSIVMCTDTFTGELRNREPEKCESWEWYDPRQLPEPCFDASRRGIDCYLQGTFYKKYE